MLHRNDSKRSNHDAPEKWCRKLEQLKEKMETKTEEMEAGYDALIKLEPEDEKRHLKTVSYTHLTLPTIYSV